MLGSKLSEALTNLKKKGKVLGKNGKKKGISKSKAREMLHDGTVHGKPLSNAQRALFGLISSGRKPTRLSK